MTFLFFAETLFAGICLACTFSMIYDNWYNPIVWYRKPAMLVTGIIMLFAANSYAKYQIQDVYNSQRSSVFFYEFFKFLILIFLFGIIAFLLKELIIGKNKKSIYRWKSVKVIKK